MRTNTDEEWVGRAANPRGWIWGGIQLGEAVDG